MGTNYTANAGLKIANQSANVTADDPKWGYPGGFLPRYNNLHLLLLQWVEFKAYFQSKLSRKYVFKDWNSLEGCESKLDINILCTANSAH